LKALITGVVCAAAALTASAQSEPRLNDCDWPANARNLVEPWNKHSRTFANGKIRIAHLDTGGEPVCCSSHLLILAPDPEDELGNRSCHLLSDGETGTGFQTLTVPDASATYDPAKGLLISVPVERYIDGLKSRKAVISVRINQATGSVTVE